MIGTYKIAGALALAVMTPHLAACVAPGGETRSYEGLDLPTAETEKLAQDLRANRISSEALVRGYTARIGTIDRSGPTLRSVIAINPDALGEAQRLDDLKRNGSVKGPLHGLPLLLKDNIESRDPVATTAGSLALQRNFAVRDAPLVARLRAAGAVILGKANLDEWSNIRSPRAIRGWSAVGGQTLNPHVLDRAPSGSSSGSAVAVAAGLAAAAIGTDTGGSLTSPAAVNGVVALRPTLGLVSRTGIVPIAASQDTAGPIARTVAGVAMLLSVMAGSDPADPATLEADRRKTDYLRALDSGALKGKRLGVMRFSLANYSPEALRQFDEALQVLKAAGAEIVEIHDYSVPAELGSAAGLTTITEFKEQIDAYLAKAPPSVATRSLADLIAFNEANRATEMASFGHEYWTFALTTSGTQAPDYLKSKALAKRLAGTEGIDALLSKHRLDALIAPTMNPAPLLQPKEAASGREASVAQLPAVAGYPHLTVPMGFVGPLPVGLSFIGTAWSDAELLAMGFAFEQRTKAIRPPRFLPSIEADAAN